MAAGRKSKYESCVKPKLKQITKWSSQGLTENTIAKNLGIAQSTWSDYKSKYSELAEAIKKGRKDVIVELRGALLKKAIGYNYSETKTVALKIEIPKGLAEEMKRHGMDVNKAEKVKLIRTETTNKWMPEDVAALNLALKNYDKENWSNDPQALEIRKREISLKEKAYEDGNW